MKFINTRSLEARNNTAYNVSDYIDARVLAANVAETVTVPTEAAVAVFSCVDDFYINFNGVVAAVPAADINDGTAPVLRPTTKAVVAGQTFSIVAPAITTITIEYFAQG